MKKIKTCGILIVLVSCILLISCNGSDRLKDGYYKAETSEYDHGWKEFVSVCVMKGNIVSVEYNAKNSSGFIKSWDMAYMRNMDKAKGTYPNEYTRNYARQFFENQNAAKVDALSGASSSAGKFEKLAAAVFEQAKKGDTTIAVIDVRE